MIITCSRVGGSCLQEKKYNLIQLKVTLVDEEKEEMILTIA